MNGAFAIPGPPVILYVVATLSEPVKSRAFLMMFFWCSSVVSLVMFGAAGLISPRPFQLLGCPASHVAGQSGGELGFRPLCRRSLSTFCGGALYSDWPFDLGQSGHLGLITA